MDYKKVLRLHFVNHLSCREIAESCGDCSKTVRGKVILQPQGKEFFT